MDRDVNSIRSKSVAAALLLLIATAVYAQQSTTPPAVLFLNTNPLHADVLLDGRALAEPTPMLLRELAAGTHELELRKTGYTTERREIELAAGEMRILDVALSSLTFAPELPEEESIHIGGNEEKAGEMLFQLPEGSYSFTRDEEGLRIEPVFPQDGWIRGLNLAIPLSVAFSAVLTLHDIFYPKRAAVSFGGDVSLSPVTLSAYGLTLTLCSFDLALGVKRRKAERAFSYSAIPRQQALHYARELYERAENLLGLGQLEEALRIYTRVLKGYKDSPLYPYALFKSARIHYLTGEDSLAAIEFNLVAEHYPLPDLYDKAKRGLADILLRRGEFPQSIAQLQSMVYADTLYTEEGIELLQAEVLEVWFGEDPSVLDQLITAYLSLLQRYLASQSADLYRYKAAHYLHFADRNPEAARLLEEVDLQAVDVDLAERIRDLRRFLENLR